MATEIRSNKRRFLAPVAALLVAALAVMATQSPSSAATLKVGDAAPPLKVGKWVKGEPVTKFEPGTVYVMEFWATWCGPCVSAIPHVTELQKKFDGKVVMIGQNVWERDETKVVPFVTKMGDKMGYRVVMDDKSANQTGEMAASWMEAAGQNGIPCSMIIDQQGKIAWIGHPMEMEEVLAKVVEGKYDLKSAGAAAGEKQGRQQKMMELQKRLGAAMAAKDGKAAMAVVDEISAMDPKLAAKAPAMKFQVLLQLKQYDEAYAMGDALVESIKDDAAPLNQFAWVLATQKEIEKRDLKLAQRLAERGVEVTKRKDAQVLDTLARIMFDQGEVEKAVAIATEAAGVAKPEDKAEILKTLETYKAGKK